MALGRDQRDFIKNKVAGLGSIQATKQFYTKDCLVDQWANVYATTFFKTVTQNSQAKNERR